MSEQNKNERSLIQGPPKLQGPRIPLANPRPDPQRPPTMGEMIREGLANFIGFGGEIDPMMGPISTTPRAKGLEAPAAFGAIAGLLNPATARRVLGLLKIPNSRLTRTTKAFEELKQHHPGVALISDVQDFTGQFPSQQSGAVAAVGPVQALRSALTPDSPFIPTSPGAPTFRRVQAPEAPVMQIGFPRRPHNTIEALDMALTGRPPSTIGPGRIQLQVTEALEDYDPVTIYGMLKHEANHAAQFAKDPAEMMPRYIQGLAQDYFKIPEESRARFAGYKGMAEALRRSEGASSLNSQHLQNLRILQDNERFFDIVADPRSSAGKELIRELLNLTPTPPKQQQLFFKSR
jgi:hypothetical protein